MSTPATRAILLATALSLADCGGGGGGLASGGSTPPPTTPPPPPSPPPSEAAAIIPAATTSQQFAVMGMVTGDAFQNGPTIDSSVQIKVRYDASSQSYEVMLPDAQDWQKITPSGTSYQGTSVLVWSEKADYQYSRLLTWNDGANSGRNAVGMATQAGGVPVTGNATYSGQILGQTSEPHRDSSGSPVDGSITLSFNFGAGSLSGSITPNLHQGFDLGTINFRDAVYSTGSTTFSGKFDTSAVGVNSFSGQLTGPHAEELIGSFALPYHSPIDGQDYQAEGAFVGAK
jgi:hypothetical protein